MQYASLLALQRFPETAINLFKIYFKKKINNYLQLKKPQIKVVDGNKHKNIFLSLQKYQQCSVFICQETRVFCHIVTGIRKRSISGNKSSLGKDLLNKGGKQNIAIGLQYGS